MPENHPELIAATDRLIAARSSLINAAQKLANAVEKLKPDGLIPPIAERLKALEYTLN